jgi:hypothetical protein
MLVDVGNARELGLPAETATIRFGEADKPPGSWAGRRYLYLNDQPAFELSYWCGTCAFLFRRLEGANETTSIDHDDLRARLAAGADGVDEVVIEAYGQLVTRGTYIPLLLEVRPRLVRPGTPEDYFSTEQVSVWGLESFWDLPRYPATPYFRTFQTAVDSEAHLYEFVTPMVPPNYNQQERVQEYVDAMAAGGVPCIVALSTLDITAPAVANGDDWCAHWGLTHFLLDGHHKLEAAATSGRPVRMLSLLAVDEGLSTSDQVERLLEVRTRSEATRIPTR